MLILTGGVSRRMGRPKALLPLTEGHTTTFIERLECITRKVAEKRAVVSSLSATDLPVDLPVISQPRPEEGQLSSLLLGWEAYGGGCDWVMVCPVDHPYPAEKTLLSLLEAVAESPDALMWSPSYRERGGHPVIFSSALMERLKDSPVEQGARPVVQALGQERCRVETDDPAVLWDVDTPEDYAKFSGAFGTSG